MASAGFAQDAARHGGRLAQAMAAYPHAPRPWLDLSTGISPWAWSGPRASLDDLRRLPDPQDLAALEQAAADAFGVADPGRVVAVAGVQAGIGLLAATLGLGKVAVAPPTYSGHAQGWTAAGAQVGDIEADEIDRCDAPGLVVVNPNNPDGRSIAPNRLLTLAADRSAKGSWTLVDEAFVETTPGSSIAATPIERLVVLRSFGKFYGLPGVRLGFVIAAPDLCGQLRARQGDWPVGAGAIVMGTAAYHDTAWAQQQTARLRAAADRLDKLLIGNGFEAPCGTSLFRLARHADAAGRFERLCAAGVLVRPFAHDPAVLRFGLPGPDDWGRLAAALDAAR